MRWIIVIIVLLLAACTPTPPETQQVLLPAARQGGSTEPTSLPPPAPYPGSEGPYPAAPEAAVEAEPAQAVPEEPAYPAPEQTMLVPGTVTFTTDDGLDLVGTFASPDTPGPWPTVLLLHMLGSNRTAYDAVLPRFTAAGYAVLALDMRGHGDTGGENNWDLSAKDLEEVIRILSDQPEVLATQMAIVGASIGSNMALKTGAAVPTVATVVLLSPGLDYLGVTTEDALADYGDRPILIVASREDTYAANSSQTLADQAGGLVNFKLYEGAGHGTAMFGAEEGLMDLILAHLNQYVR